MKKTSVILVILLIAIVIVAAIGIAPVVIFTSVTDAYQENMFSETSNYQSALKSVNGNEALSTSIKGNVTSMANTAKELFEKTRISYFWVMAYLIIVISAALIIVGAYLIKNETSKNYIGTALIVSACALIAFCLLLGIYVYA